MLQQKSLFSKPIKKDIKTAYSCWQNNYVRVLLEGDICIDLDILSCAAWSIGSSNLRYFTSQGLINCNSSTYSFTSNIQFDSVYRPFNLTENSSINSFDSNINKSSTVLSNACVVF